MNAAHIPAVPTNLAGWTRNIAYSILWAYERDDEPRLHLPARIARMVDKKLVLNFEDERHEWRLTKNKGWIGRKKRHGSEHWTYLGPAPSTGRERG